MNTLAWVIVGAFVVHEGMEIGAYVCGADLPQRPVAFRLVAFVFTVAAVWLAVRTIS